MTTPTFAALNLRPELQRALDVMGFTTPSPIQEKAIPVILTGKDVIGQAQTGTGKTAAYAVPIVEQLTLNQENPAMRAPQVLVLAPTRELATQISDVFRDLMKFMPGGAVVSIYGGQPMDRQFMALRKQPQIITATPGRLLDHIRRGSIRLHMVNKVVLDEADEMLKMGFRDDIEAILSLTAKERQTILLSATMPRPIMDMAKTHQTEPEHIRIAPIEKEKAQIKESFITVNQSGKPEALTTLLKDNAFESMLVFCNTKLEVDTVVETLYRNGHRAEGLHGGKPQHQRERILGRFRKGTTTILVATDVAARGIDVDNIQAVLNYDFPEKLDSYTHRIGRTGRAGKEGLAFSFLTHKESQVFQRMRRNPDDPSTYENRGMPKSRRNGGGYGGGYRGKRFGSDSSQAKEFGAGPSPNRPRRAASSASSTATGNSGGYAGKTATGKASASNPNKAKAYGNPNAPKQASRKPGYKPQRALTTV